MGFKFYGKIYFFVLNAPLITIYWGWKHVGSFALHVTPRGRVFDYRPQPVLWYVIQFMGGWMSNIISATCIASFICFPLFYLFIFNVFVFSWYASLVNLPIFWNLFDFDSPSFLLAVLLFCWFFYLSFGISFG